MGRMLAIFVNKLIYDNATAAQGNSLIRLLNCSLILSYVSAVAKTKKIKEQSVPEKPGRGRPSLGKKTVSIRLSEDVLAQAKKAAAIGGNLSAYIELAIKNQLKRGSRKEEVPSTGHG
jgi:hypothetical protein